MNTLSQSFTTYANYHNSEYDLNALPVDKARRFILDQLTPITNQEQVATRSALGRILANDIVAPFNVPAHDNSAMDGYGFRYTDLKQANKTILPVVATVLAGPRNIETVLPGTAVRIMTGAPIPGGIDTVIPLEKILLEDNNVVIPTGQKLGQHIRRAGEDLTQGEVALKKGKKIGPAEMGLIASLGFAEVSVIRRLRIAFFSTGDELASIGSPLKPGQIFDSNRFTLFGMLEKLGCISMDLGVIPDDAEALRKAFLAASTDADIVITSGGVSVGEADFVKKIMAELGEILFWKIAMKPGRPLAFGKLANGCWLFGLPGNPVSAMATFYQFVQPALLKLMGITHPQMNLSTFKLPLQTAIKKAPGKTEFQRGIFCIENGKQVVKPLPNQSSGILRSMSEANCFIVLPADASKIDAGTEVEVQLFDRF